jgi:hypothetical protein
LTVMADDAPVEKKPRTRMTTDELLEETHIAFRKVIAMLEKEGLHTQSVAHLQQLDASVAWTDALSLALDLGLTMPYLDHDALFLALLDAYECVAQMKFNARRNCYRKVKILEADSKTDPEILKKWLTDRSRTENESAVANIACCRMRHVIKSGAAARPVQQ